MNDLLNSPLILCIVFPAVTILGVVPLLRWAVSHEKRDIVACVAFGLACILSALLAFGKPAGPFQFGMHAIVYALIVVTFFSLVISFWISNSIAKTGLASINVLIWAWFLVGMPLSLEALIKATLAGAGLIAVGWAFYVQSRQEIIKHGDPISAFLMLSVISGALAIHAGTVNDLSAQNFAVALFVIGVSACVWTLSRFDFDYQENAIAPLSLAVASLGWEMWLQGYLPLISLICLAMVMYTKAATMTVLEKMPEIAMKGFYLFLVLFCLVPVCLSYLFFEILRNL